MTDDPVGTAASNNPVLTTLTQAVTAANLVDTLNSAPALTVFAPTDCAFAAADPATIEAALADPTGLLTTVLGFHVVPGEELDAAALAGETSVTTLTGEELSISVGRRHRDRRRSGRGRGARHPDGQRHRPPHRQRDGAAVGAG